eukprot:CAMPEP_0175469824 /NCGR_PEP_ID=MMETSP0095-20121207/72537_1 /TAXON_ID=311494 /ORGANISM="Alexandrium monilatum, Strain CCMP3105" /LENGTH=47 /DNA_ID= /DNA_START= /DNA_END= /DNA_ORIENTATION=
MIAQLARSAKVEREEYLQLQMEDEQAKAEEEERAALRCQVQALTADA